MKHPPLWLEMDINNSTIFWSLQSLMVSVTGFPHDSVSYCITQWCNTVLLPQQVFFLETWDFWVFFIVNLSNMARKKSWFNSLHYCLFLDFQSCLLGRLLCWCENRKRHKAVLQAESRHGWDKKVTPKLPLYLYWVNIVSGVISIQQLSFQTQDPKEKDH